MNRLPPLCLCLCALLVSIDLPAQSCRLVKNIKAPSWSVRAAIPNNPTLCGTRVALQSVWGAPGKALTTDNGIVLTLGH